MNSLLDLEARQNELNYISSRLPELQSLIQSVKYMIDMGHSMGLPDNDPSMSTRILHLREYSEEWEMLIAKYHDHC